MTLQQARKFALSLPEATEEPHFEFTSFRIGGKIFATAPPESDYLHIFVPEEFREAALGRGSDFLEELRWGKRVLGLRVMLPAAKPADIHALLEEAWTHKAPKRLRALGESKE
jgi:hypothetical protein